MPHGRNKIPPEWRQGTWRPPSQPLPVVSQWIGFGVLLPSSSSSAANPWADAAAQPPFGAIAPCLPQADGFKMWKKLEALELEMFKIKGMLVGLGIRKV